VVPAAVLSHGAVGMYIETNGAAGFARLIEVANVAPNVVPVVPGIFAGDASGSGQAAAFNNEDGTVNSPAHPVKRGSSVGVFATGLGPTNPVVPDGQITLPSQLPLNEEKVEVFLGGQIVAADYAGAAPNSVAGISQINFTVPNATPPGLVPVYISSGSTITSQSGVWIAVQ
jgi:uncharacterized protein (TIGR03437 family)